MSKKEKDNFNIGIRKVIVGIVNLIGIIDIKKCTALVLVCVPNSTEEQIYGNISACVKFDQTVSYSEGYLF